MSETGTRGKGTGSLNALLRAWPDADKSAEDADARARRVVGRIASGEEATASAHVSDDALFAAPLGESPEDGHKMAPEARPMTIPADRERERRSLQDLAKMARETPAAANPPRGRVPSSSGVLRAAEADKEDSGIVDLAAAAKADPEAETRAQTTALASEGLFDETPAQPVPSVVPQSIVRTQPSPVAKAVKKPGGRVLPIVIALGALAAGTLVFVRGKTPEAPVAVAPPPPVEVKPALPAPVAEPPAASSAMALGDLPPAANAAESAKLAAKAPAAKPVVRGEAPAKIDPPPAKVAEIVPPPSGPGTNLESAMKTAAGELPKTPAAATTGGAAQTGNVPQKPSQGAVTGALGAVLPGARACLGPDDPISRATVIFASDGSVQSVNVSGGAAGTPAEACIKSALVKARLQPFAEPSYGAPITIRHN